MSILHKLSHISRQKFLVIGGIFLVGLFITLCLFGRPILQSAQLAPKLFVPNRVTQTQPATISAQTTSPCPRGFILVPGDPLYHTSDFCVMKYDAKCANNSDPTTGIRPAVGSNCAAGNGTYKNNGKDCTCTGNRQVVSTQSGFPITYIPETSTASTSAKSYCEERGWHLLTNNEWMTIARNVEKVAANWCDKNGTNCGFAPGTTGKILANGHNDNHNENSISGTTHGALVAGSDDQPCFGTTTDGSNRCGGVSSQKRTLTLSNQTVIWDLAGNVWQWIDAEVMRQDQPKSVTHNKLDHGWIWSDFSPGAKSTVIIDNGTGPWLGYAAFRPSNPTWNSNNGVGRVYHYSAAGDTSTTQYTFIRGGNWRHGYDSGAFTIHMSPTAQTQNIDDVGFRCAVSFE